MWGASLISCKLSIPLGTVESPLGGYLIRCRLGSTWCRRYRQAVGRSGAAGEPASGATGLVEALRTGVWSPGSGLKLGAAWPVTWGARPTSVHFRLHSSEPGGSGLDSLQALTFGGSGPPKCLGMMTAWFPSADGRWGCDFPIHLAVTHTHRHTHIHALQPWGLCFHDSERAMVPGDPSRPCLPCGEVGSSRSCSEVWTEEKHKQQDSGLRWRSR